MSDYGYVADRARQAFSSVARSEQALARNPRSISAQLNYASRKKFAEQTQDELFRLSEERHIEVCNYRLLPESAKSYGLPYISKSFLEYQNPFSQIYDAKRNGQARTQARIGKEAWEESILEFAYSYSGSLGVVLLVQSDRDFFEGKLDTSIDSLFVVLEINSQSAVRETAQTLGYPVVKRVYDWSIANIEGGFAADVRWNRSDGRQLGQVIDRQRMETIVDIVSATSDEQTSEISIEGMLVGGDLVSGTFHFVVPNGEGYRGYVAENFSPDTEMTLGKAYVARIKETMTVAYAADRTDRRFELLSLGEPSSA